MDADHASSQERLGVEDRAVDVRLGRKVEDRIGVGDERPDRIGIGDVAAHERQTGRLLRIIEDRLEIGLVTRVRERVEDGDPGAIPSRLGPPGRKPSR